MQNQIPVTFVTFVQTRYTIYFPNVPRLINHIWEEIQHWILIEAAIDIHFNRYGVMFGLINSEKGNIVNWLIINIKYYI